jgi:hypothetical protein
MPRYYPNVASSPRREFPPKKQYPQDASGVRLDDRGDYMSNSYQQPHIDDIINDDVKFGGGSFGGGGASGGWDSPSSRDDDGPSYDNSSDSDNGGGNDD